MNTRRFICGSSIILAGWLGATFLNEVPAQRYPKLDKKPATAHVDHENSDLILVNRVKPATLPASLSR